MSVKVTKRGNGIERLKNDLARIVNMDVLVGIPQENTDRKTDDGVTNSQLLFIHTHGSHLHNIPARPVIEPAIQAEGNKEQIVEQLGKAAENVLKGNPSEALNSLKKAGLAGKNAATGWFVDPRNNWPPNSPATIARKEKKMTEESKKAAIEAGNPLTRPLIDTGELRKSLTFVVRERKK